MSNKKLFTETLSPNAEAWLCVQEIKPSRWMFTRIEVPEEFRRQKVGTQLIDRMCNWADEEGIVLVVKPDEHMEWPVEWLELFFFKIQENGNMIREPQPK